MRTRLLCGAVTLLIGCASAPKPAPGEGSVSVRVDAVLPSGRNLFIFDFAQSRYQKWNLSQGPFDSLGMCRILDTLAGGWADASHWLALPSPSRPFAPMQAIWGASGDFYLLDRAGKRLNLYDTNAQFLSSFSLPQEIRERNLDRFEIFWTRNGQFSFLDLGEGKLWQYAELRTTENQGDWRLQNSGILPAGLESCRWEPYYRDPCCLRDGKETCFDKYFNPVGPSREAGDAGPHPGMTRTGEWKLMLDGGAACGPRPPACFLPDKGLYPACPPETGAAPPR